MTVRRVCETGRIDATSTFSDVLGNCVLQERRRMAQINAKEKESRLGELPLPEKSDRLPIRSSALS